MKRARRTLLLLIFVSWSCFGVAAESEETKHERGEQKFGFHFVARPLVGVADFGRSNFKHDLKTKLGFKLPAYTFGTDIQIGLISSKRWGVGFNFSFYTSGKNENAKEYYRLFSINEGFYGEYAFVRKNAFELNGQLGIGLGQSFFNYENTETLLDNISLDDYRQLGTVLLRQKVLGYASIGISAKWIVSKTFAWGIHVKWLQQIGQGRWYASKSDIRINDLSKSSFVPLQLGIDLNFGTL